MSFRTPTASAHMFPDRATISVAADEVDEEGAVTQAWIAIAADIPAQIASAGGTTELRNAEGSFQVRGFRVILQGWHPEADEAARVTVGDRVFDVRGIEPDSWGVAAETNGWTILTVEERAQLEDGGS